MRVTTLLNRLLRLPGLWVRGIDIRDDELVVRIHRRFRLLTCPECGTRVRGRFEEKTRQWRHQAIWGRTVYLEGPIRRLRCPRCRAVRTEAVPWARHGSDFTRPFEDTVGYLAQKMDQTAVTRVAGIAWTTVGRIAKRLMAEKLDESRFDGLRRIGIDEVYYRYPHRFLTVVVDHDQECVVWAGKGKNEDALTPFFRELGPERAREIELVSVDMARAYTNAVTKHLPNAQIVYDRFHLVRLAQDALDAVRKHVRRQLPRGERTNHDGMRWVVLRRSNADDKKRLFDLALTETVNIPLYRSYLVKEALLKVYEMDEEHAARAWLRDWVGTAGRVARPFARLAGTVRNHLEGIVRSAITGLSNGRVEGLNNKIRLLNHRAFGYHSAAALIATVYLCCSNIVLAPVQLL